MRGVKDDAVTVPVKPEIDPVSATLRSELQNQMRAIARRIALEVPVSADSDGLRARLQSQLDGIRSTLAMQVPTEPADADKYRRSLRGLLDSVRETQHVNVDVDKDIDTDKSRGGVERAGNSVGRLFTSAFGSTLLNPLIGIPALILAAIAAPVAGAVTAGAALAGGGLASIFIGALALRADEELKTAAGGLVKTLDTTLTEAAKPLKGPFLEAIGILGKAIKEELGPALKDLFEEIGPSIPKLAQGFAGFLKQLSDTGALEKFGKAVGPALDQLAMALPDIGNAIAQLLISFAEAGPGGADALGKTLRTIADTIRFVGDAIEFLTDVFEGFGNVTDWVKERFKDLATGILTVVMAIGFHSEAIEDLKEAIKKIAGDIADLWRRLWDGMSERVSSTIDSAVGFARGLPGKIKTAVGDLASLLLDAGKNVVQSLIDGIKSKLGALANIAAQMAGTIRNFLPFSPAKEGPLSGSGNPFASGQAIATNLAAGVESELPRVTSAADELASVFGGGVVGGSGAAMRSVPPVVEIDGRGLPDALDEWLRHNTRIKSPDGSTDGAYAAA